jgi:hypothetical protein
MTFSPFISLLNYIYYICSGRLRFPCSRVGEAVAMPDGKIYTIFRQAVMAQDKSQTSRPAVFQVRFRITSMTPRQNEIFSLIPIPFITGLPGFRSKLWMVERNTGECQGVYEWDSVENAQRYANSFAMRFMSNRAEHGSVWYRIYEL